MVSLNVLVGIQLHICMLSAAVMQRLPSAPQGTRASGVGRADRRVLWATGRCRLIMVEEKASVTGFPFTSLAGRLVCFDGSTHHVLNTLAD